MTEAEWFKNETDAYKWLREQGYDVSRGKFNQDKNAGLLQVDGKRISKFSVLQYGLKLKQVTQLAPAAEDTQRKSKAEADKAVDDARIARVKAEEAERELDAKWHLRAEHERDMAAYAGLIQDAFRHRVYLDHYELLLACGGDHARSSEFAHALQEFCDRALNDVSEYKELTVELEMPEGEDEDD